MARYASGKYAYGISDRSGFRYRLREMRKEWNGLLVGPDEYEEKHPQLEAPNVGADPQALRDPRPDRNEGDFNHGTNGLVAKRQSGNAEVHDERRSWNRQ